MNFRNETVAAIRKINKQTSDVITVFSVKNNFTTDWITFNRIANFDYDNSYGGRYIVDDLVILFKDGSWLERDEYDGAEWWEYKSLPINNIQKPLEDRSQLYQMGEY